MTQLSGRDFNCCGVDVEIVLQRFLGSLPGSGI